VDSGGTRSVVVVLSTPPRAKALGDFESLRGPEGPLFHDDVDICNGDADICGYWRWLEKLLMRDVNSVFRP
jgi:hypothetical protein